MAASFALGDNFNGGDMYSGPILSSFVGGRSNANYITNNVISDYERPRLSPTRKRRSSESNDSQGRRCSIPDLGRAANPIENELDFGDISENPEAYFLLQEDARLVDELKTSFNSLRNYVAHHNPEWLVRGGTLRAKAEHLTALASIATFLGLLQIGFMTFAADGDLASLRNSFNILSYCALLVDSFSALFAVLASGSFSLAASPTKDYTAPRQAIDLRVILADIRARKVRDESHSNEQAKQDADGKSSIMDNVQACKEACDEEYQVAERLTKKMKSFSTRDTFEYPIILFFTSIGAYFFVISTIIFVIQTQPRVVSITIGTVAAVFTAIYATFVVLHMWSRISSWLPSPFAAGRAKGKISSTA